MSRIEASVEIDIYSSPIDSESGSLLAQRRMIGGSEPYWHGASPMLRQRAGFPHHGASPILRRRAGRPEPGSYRGPTTGFGHEVGKYEHLRADNPEDRAKIDAYMKEAGISQSSENIAWCAAWLNAQLAHEGVKGSGGLDVASFERWGKAERANQAHAGDVMIVNGGAHVGRFTGEIDPATGKFGFYSGNAGERGEPAPAPGRSQWGGVETRWIDPEGVDFRAPPEGAATAVSVPPLNYGNLSSGADRMQYSRGVQNFNPTNIGYGNWAASHGATGGMGEDTGHQVAVFPDYQTGLNAAQSLALDKYNGGKKSADELIAGANGWTPNNHEAAANVARTMGLAPDDDLNLGDPARMNSFLRALTMQEVGPEGARYIFNRDARSQYHDAAMNAANQ